MEETLSAEKVYRKMQWVDGKVRMIEVLRGCPGGIPILKLGSSDESWVVREATMQALRYYDCLEAIKLLIQNVNDGNPKVARKAREALISKKSRHAQIVAEIEKDIDAEIAQYSTNLGGIEVKIGILKEIACQGSQEAVQLLIVLYGKSNCISLQRMLIKALGESRSPKAVAPLINDLQNYQVAEEVAEELASALVKIGSKEAIEGLLEELNKGGQNAGVIKKAINARPALEALQKVTSNL